VLLQLGDRLLFPFCAFSIGLQLQKLPRLAALHDRRENSAHFLHQSVVLPLRQRKTIAYRLLPLRQRKTIAYR